MTTQQPTATAARCSSREPMEVTLTQRDADDDPRTCCECGGRQPSPEQDLLDRIKLDLHRTGDHGWCSPEECPEALSRQHTVLVSRILISPMIYRAFAFGHTRGERLPVVVMGMQDELLRLRDVILSTGAPVELTSTVVATGDTAVAMAARWTLDRRARPA
jgi:hypothetical protein